MSNRMLRRLATIAVLGWAVGWGAGCVGDATREQVELQRQQIENYAAAADKLGLSLIVVGTLSVDGRVGFENTLKLLPFEGTLYTIMFNSQAEARLKDFLDRLGGGQAATTQPAARREEQYDDSS